jgi:hypothetical protein
MTELLELIGPIVIEHGLAGVVIIWLVWLNWQKEKRNESLTDSMFQLVGEKDTNNAKTLILLEKIFMLVDRGGQ